MTPANAGSPRSGRSFTPVCLAPPARVLDLGCGPLGGFVPFLHSNGCQATGVDPNAPNTPDYHRVEFRRGDRALVPLN
jgi:hypothetical protein